MVATPIRASPDEPNPSPSTQESVDAELIVDLLSDSLQLLLLIFGCVVVFSLNG
jgi:hypothetical protein